jgi:hypothetical protein
MVPQIPSSVHYLMSLYALGHLWSKGGSRTQLGISYLRRYYDELNQFIGEYIENDDEEIIRDTYR